MGDRAEAVISSTMDSHWIVSADSWSRWIIALSFGSVVRRGSSINNARSLSIVTDDDVLLDVVAIMLAPVTAMSCVLRTFSFLGVLASLYSELISSGELRYLNRRH